MGLSYEERERRRKRLYRANLLKTNPEKLRSYARAYYLNELIRNLVMKAKGRAKALGMAFDGLPDIRESRPAACACCGVTLDYNPRNGKPMDASPSLDRVDPAQGYVSANVRVICYRCNTLKRDGTLAEFQMIVAYMRKSAPNAVPLNRSARVIV